MYALHATPHISWILNIHLECKCCCYQSHEEKAVPRETEKGVALAPSAKDLKLRFSSRNSDKTEEVEDERKVRSDPYSTLCAY